MAITRLSSTDRSRIKRAFLFLYVTACALLGWWIGGVLLLLIVPARGRSDVFESQRRMHIARYTIKLIGCQTNLEPRVRRSISGYRAVHRLLPPVKRISS